MNISKTAAGLLLSASFGAMAGPADPSLAGKSDFCAVTMRDGKVLAANILRIPEGKRNGPPVLIMHQPKPSYTGATGEIYEREAAGTIKPLGGTFTVTLNNGQPSSCTVNASGPAVTYPMLGAPRPPGT